MHAVCTSWLQSKNLRGKGMRKVKEEQLRLGAVPISHIEIDLESRDEIAQLLYGLQALYIDPDSRKKAFELLKKIISPNVNCHTGRRGMDLWQILVLGLLRANCNWDFDHLRDMANNHLKIREMMGLSPLDLRQFKLQTIKDNLSLLSPEVLDELNVLAVTATHKKLGYEQENLKGKCDSFVVETDVHYPTDINLLLDAIRKVIELIAKICTGLGLTEWRQSKYILKSIKKKYRKAQKLKPSNSKNQEKIQAREQEIIKAHQEYIDTVSFYLTRAKKTLEFLTQYHGSGNILLALLPIEKFINHAERQIDQIYRRVILDEKIPHAEKVFSIFEEHTEWINKGKAGVPQELGLNVCIVHDQHGLILNHRVMQGEKDQEVAVPIVEEAQRTFSNLNSCSFDKGFWNPDNRKKLGSILDEVTLPKKGKLSKKDKEEQASESFIEGRRQHPAVESSINALENHGLDRCLDHGIHGFKRYISLSVLARNIQILGHKLQQLMRKKLKMIEKIKKAKASKIYQPA